MQAEAGQGTAAVHLCHANILSNEKILSTVVYGVQKQHAFSCKAICLKLMCFDNAHLHCFLYRDFKPYIWRSKRKEKWVRIMLIFAFCNHAFLFIYFSMLCLLIKRILLNYCCYYDYF